MSEASDRAKDCRAHADRCRAWADLATKQASREEFLRLSEQWDQLCGEIEQIGRMRMFITSGERAQTISRAD